MTITKRVNIINDIRGHVLDDDKEMNEMLAEIFRLHGLPNIHFYDNTDKFLSETDGNVHLCLIDYLLDGPLTGLDVARIIKKKYPKCKIIFVSGQTSLKVMKELINIGIDGYVDKDEHDYMECVSEMVTNKLAEIKSNLELAQLLEEDRQNRKNKKTETNDY